MHRDASARAALDRLESLPRLHTKFSLQRRHGAFECFAKNRSVSVGDAVESIQGFAANFDVELNNV